MLDKIFHITSSKSTVKNEIIAGFTTFMTMSYIIFVNPDILSNAGMPKDALITATCLAAAFASILMGLYANYPIGLATSMTSNVFFAFVIVKSIFCLLASKLISFVSDFKKTVLLSILAFILLLA